MEKKTRSYSTFDNKTTPTATYQADSTKTYAETSHNLTRAYGDQSPRATITAHNLAIGDTITLNDKTYTVTDIISQETGEAVIYTIQGQQHQIFALKLYFEFPNPKEEPNPEALRRIQKIKDLDILRLYDFGTGASKYQGKYCFEICDAAKGGNLLARQEYSLKFLKETVIPQIFRGIRTLHDHKIYHCDLKPENIFWLDAEQTDLVIGDYGSAKTFEESSDKDLRQTTTAKGTMFYLALEQSIGIISAKNDYYSFGMILLHLLYPGFVNRESLRKIRERQMSKKPITDYDSRYGEFNDLIAGLTLADVSVRWGETEVRKWMWGEKVPILYTSDAEIHPIKFKDATIRSPQGLTDYIESHVDWIEDLIEDQEGYQALLRWVGDIQNLSQKKVFDNMVKHYLQDGEGFLKQAVLRYFDPDRPVQVDMKEYDFWNAPDLEKIATQFFQQLDNSAQVTAISKKRFSLFQLEFVLRQLEMMAEDQNRLVARSLLNKMEAALHLRPKTTFEDSICPCYPKVSEENFPVLLYTFAQQKSIHAVLNTHRQELHHIDEEYQQAEQSFETINTEYQNNQQRIEKLQQSVNNAERQIKYLQGDGFAMLSTILLFAAYPLTGLIGYLFAIVISGGPENVNMSIWGCIVLWPLMVLFGLLIGLIQLITGAGNAGESFGAVLFILFALLCSLLPAGLSFLWATKGPASLQETIIERENEIARLRGRNSEILNALNQRQELYEGLKRKKPVIENKIAHFENEMKRV